MKKINKILLIVLGVTFNLLVGANAAEKVEPIVVTVNQENSSVESQKITQEEREDISAHNFPIVGKSQLKKQRKEWLKGKKGADGEWIRKPKKTGLRDGVYIGWGEAEIIGHPKQIDFGQKRIIAFEKAYADAKGRFVMAIRNEIAVKLERSLGLNDQENSDKEIKDGRVSSITKKMGVLTEAYVDKALRELGVDPLKIENSDIISKRLLAQDAFNKSLITKSAENLPGIRILATFEIINKEETGIGKNSIGVLIQHKASYGQLARAIASGKLVDYPSKTNPVDDIYSQLQQTLVNDEDYIPQHGVRIMADEAGNRVLVSFGQWSPKITNSTSLQMQAISKKVAGEIAYDQAISYMAQFVNTAIVLNKDTDLSANDNTVELTKTNNRIEKMETSEVGSMFDKYIKETSNWTPNGVVPVTTWEVNHPETGHIIIGEVLMWSPITHDYAKGQLKSNKKIKKIGSVKENQKKKKEEVESKIRTSIDLGDDDF